jgi:hypothetical protein
VARTRTTRAARAREAIFALVLPLALAAGISVPGCGGGGGSSGAPAAGGVVAPGTGGPPGGGTSAVSQAQLQVALAAMGGASNASPGGPEITPAACAAWSRLIEHSWPELQRRLNPGLESEVRAAVGGLGQGNLVRVLGIRSLAIDTNAPLGLEGSTQGSALTLGVVAPLAPGASWRLSFTADVGATIQTRVLGINIPITIALEVVVDVTDVRVRASGSIDASNPVRPTVVSAGAPQVDLTLTLGSGSPFLSQVVGPLNQVLDPVLRAALAGGGLYAQQQIAGFLPALNTPPWGTGGAPTSGVPGAPDLETESNKITAEILRAHLPFGTLIHPIFDDPSYGQGNIVGWGGYGDSTIWTGHYLMGEALHYDLTGDPRALDGATRVVNGLDVCVGLTGTPGLLSRNCIPATDPEFARNAGSFDWGTGVTNGVLYGGMNDISRDQYLGVYMGLLQAYLRVPALRPLAAKNITEMTQFLEASRWTLFRVREPLLWARFSPGAQTPGVVYAFTSAARIVDPAANGPIAAKYEEVSSLVWLGTWGSSREVHESYYKFNLSHDEKTILFASETDPGRYRDVVKSIEISRDVIGHHDNAWFDAVYGTGVPARARAMGAKVKDELEQWLQRPRRGFTVANSQDASVAKVLYSSPLQLQTPPQLVAVHPLPIAKRTPSDFIWQRSPFQLDGSDSPYEQPPGIELLLPYWTARSFGMLP